MYTNQANVEAKLGTTLTDEQAAYYSGVLDGGIDAYINSQTGASFGGTVAGDVYVDSLGTADLVIPTMHTITSVAKVNNDGVEEAVNVDDYVTFPRGEVDKFAIRKLNGTWSEGIENYKVSGKVGYSTIPADIVRIATELAVNSLSANANNYKSEKVGDWAVTYGESDVAITSESADVLNGYKRLSRSI